VPVNPEPATTIFFSPESEIMDSDDRDTLDILIRSAAACICSYNLSSGNAQFLGRRVVEDKFRAAFSEKNVDCLTGAPSKAAIIERLRLMLKSSGHFARELHLRSLHGTLQTIILPEHEKAFKVRAFPEPFVGPQSIEDRRNGKWRAAEDAFREMKEALVKTPSGSALLDWYTKTTPKPPQEQEEIKEEGSTWSDVVAETTLGGVPSPPTPTQHIQTTAEEAIGAFETRSPARWTESSTSPVSTPSSTPVPIIRSAAPPSLFTPLPYEIQHPVIQTLQTLLEEICHHYLKKNHPQLLIQKGWIVPACAELNVYIHEIVAIGDFEAPLIPDWGTLSRIRHIAVHREPISEERLMELFDIASDGAFALADDYKLVEMVERLREIFWEQKNVRNSASRTIRDIQSRLAYLKNLRECIDEEIASLERALPELKELRDEKSIRRLKSRLAEAISEENHGCSQEEDKELTKIWEEVKDMGFERLLDEKEMKKFDFHRHEGA
jgi:hypothetical protein